MSSVTLIVPAYVPSFSWHLIKKISSDSNSKDSPVQEATPILEPIVDVQRIKTVEELLVLPEPKQQPLRSRSFSHDSYSTLTSAADTHFWESNGLNIVWSDDVLPPAEAVCISSPRIQKARLLPDPFDPFLRDVEMDPQPQLSPTDCKTPHDEEDSEILLAKRIFSTLGVPKPPKLPPRPPQRQSQIRLPSPPSDVPLARIVTHLPSPPPTRRRTLRRSSSGGLDPYLTAPARFTRFEI